MKKCPYCVEPVLDDAILCKHCHQYIGSEIPLSDYKLGEYLEKNQYLIAIGWMITICSGLLNPFLVLLGVVMMFYLANKLDKYRNVMKKIERRRS